jgi:hypothetical protein
LSKELLQPNFFRSWPPQSLLPVTTPIQGAPEKEPEGIRCADKDERLGRNVISWSVGAVSNAAISR